LVLILDIGLNSMSYQILLAFFCLSFNNEIMNPNTTLLSLKAKKFSQALGQVQRQGDQGILLGTRVRATLSVSGWTLIELLIVIVLLGTLLVISIQALADSRVSTREAAANAMVRSLNQAQKRAYLANESPFLATPVTNPQTSVGMSNIPGVFYPAEDEDALYWYVAKGLLTPNDADHSLLDLIERAQPAPGSFQEQGIWRRVP